MRGILLDHFYVEDGDGNFYTVIGNRHPGQLVYAYMKYSPTRKKTIWRRKNVYYDRVLPTYTPKLVHEKSYMRVYDPFYDTLVPSIPLSIVAKVYDPRARLRELVVKPSDPLEEEAGYYATLMARETGVPLECIGVTGSILPGIHNPSISDVDYIVYGTRCSEKVVEAFVEGGLDFFKPFPPEKLSKWAEELSRLYRIDVADVLVAYRRWRRGVLETGREYSLAFSLDYMESYTGFNWKTIGVARLKVLVEKTPYTLNYPSRSIVAKYRVLELLEGSIKHPVKTLLSFENLYLPLIYEEGWLIVEGIIQWCPTINESRIVVGTHEHRGYVIPTR